MLKIIIKSSEVFMRKEAITRLKLKGKNWNQEKYLWTAKYLKHFLTNLGYKECRLKTRYYRRVELNRRMSHNKLY